MRVFLLTTVVTGVLFFSTLLWGFLDKPVISVDSVVNEQKLPFVTKITDNEAWIYFGYVGCSSSCPKAINEMHSSDKTFYFINLLPGLDDNAVQEYVNSFGKKNIIGLQASEEDLKNIEGFFANFQNGRIGVYNPEIHSDQLFHLKKERNDWKFIEILRGSHHLRKLDENKKLINL